MVVSDARTTCDHCSRARGQERPSFGPQTERSQGSPPGVSVQGGSARRAQRGGQGGGPGGGRRPEGSPDRTMTMPAGAAAPRPTGETHRCARARTPPRPRARQGHRQGAIGIGGDPPLDPGSLGGKSQLPPTARAPGPPAARTAAHRPRQPPAGPARRRRATRQPRVRSKGEEEDWGGHDLGPEEPATDERGSGRAGRRRARRTCGSPISNRRRGCRTPFAPRWGPGAWTSELPSFPRTPLQLRAGRGSLARPPKEKGC